MECGECLPAPFCFISFIICHCCCCNKVLGHIDDIKPETFPIFIGNSLFSWEKKKTEITSTLYPTALNEQVSYVALATSNSGDIWQLVCS